MAKIVMVPVADGTEELEAVAIVDVLRRAGAEVVIASVSGALTVKCSQGTRICADCLIGECLDKAFDLIALPGGIPGVERLRDSEELIRILKSQNDSGKLYGAICAAPAVVLQSHGLLEGKTATCHPGFADRLENRDSSKSLVVSDGNCVTSRGAGTAVDFGLALVERLFGSDKLAQVKAGLAMVN